MHLQVLVEEDFRPQLLSTHVAGEGALTAGVLPLPLSFPGFILLLLLLLLLWNREMKRQRNADMESLWSLGPAL